MNQSNANQINATNQYGAAANNLPGLQQQSPSVLNDYVRILMAATARKPSSSALRQRGDAERLRKPVKIR